MTSAIIIGFNSTAFAYAVSQSVLLGRTALRQASTLPYRKPSGFFFLLIFARWRHFSGVSRRVGMMKCMSAHETGEALIKSTCADCRQIFSLTRRFFAGILSYFKKKQRSQRENMAVRCVRGFIQWFPRSSP
jgi:hypothetical protein